MLKKNIINAWLLTAMFSITGIIALPAHAGDVSAQELAQTNNPLASMKIFNLHNYYTPGWTGLPDETANTFWLRYAQPVGKFLMRASLPFPTLPVAGQVDSESGMGDLNAFAAYLAVSKPEMTFGLLHGVGFVGALADVGLPQHEIPLALLMFNVGVELGQIMFVVVILAFVYVLQKLHSNWPAWSRQVPAYGIGIMAAFWFAERVSGF